MPTKIFSDFCPTKQTRIVAKKAACTHKKITKIKCYDPCLYGRADILAIFGLHFWRNNDLINSFWIWLTFNSLTNLKEQFSLFRFRRLWVAVHFAKMVHNKQEGHYCLQLHFIRLNLVLAERLRSLQSSNIKTASAFRVHYYQLKKPV